MCKNTLWPIITTQWLYLIVMIMLSVTELWMRRTTLGETHDFSALKANCLYISDLFRRFWNCDSFFAPIIIHSKGALLITWQKLSKGWIKDTLKWKFVAVTLAPNQMWRFQKIYVLFNRSYYYGPVIIAAVGLLVLFYPHPEI